MPRTPCPIVALLLIAAASFAHPCHSEHPSPVSAAPALIEDLGPVRVADLAGDDVPAADLVRRIRVEKAGKSPKVTGAGACLMILMEWTDHPADQTAHPDTAYQDMMFSTGTYPTGSMNDFYLENSYGLYGVTGEASGWHTSAHLYSDFTPTNYGQVRDVVEQAIQELDPLIDYGQFDNDGPDGVPNSGDDDGFVDALFFVHSGPGREQTGDDNDIWSHAWSFYEPVATDDGVSCYRYSVEPEELSDGTQITIGVFCHEYGHVLGLPDLYDTDYSTSGIGAWGLMSGGSWNRCAGDALGSSPAHFCAWSKVQLGWLTPTVVTTDQLGVVIPPVETDAVAYRFFRHGVTTGDEYFLAVNRRPVGFDAGLTRRQIDNGLPQPEGLMIYHVDDALSGNTNERHRLVDVVEASPWFHAPDDWIEHLDGPRDSATSLWLNNYNRGDNGDTWPGRSTATADSTDWAGPRDRDRFADDTIPAAEDFSCDPTGTAVENIAISGDDVIADFRIDVDTAARISPEKSLTWDFESDDTGWLYCNSYVHRDTTQSGTCGGEGGLWFGIDDDDYDCGLGYGNNWFDFTWRAIEVESDASVTLRHHWDLEVGYDYAYVEVRCAGDPDADWYEVAAFDGFSDCVTDTWALPTAAIQACANEFGYAVLDLRLRLSTDTGWSAEDGGFCGIGWWVDEVTLNGEFVVDAPTPGLGLPALLAAPSPNPFNPSTTLAYHVPAGARRVTLAVYDQRGRRVRDLGADREDGWQERTWDGRDAEGRILSSGVYFARLDVDGAQRIRKLALLK